jgi:hypothetical protein
MAARNWCNKTAEKGKSREDEESCSAASVIPLERESDHRFQRENKINT